MEIKISGATIKIIPRSLLASLRTIYGVGRVRAKKLSDFLLNHPNRGKSKINLVSISNNLEVQKLFKAIIVCQQLKAEVFSNLERKSLIKCYKAKRILQNLPSRGQRTHTNSGTPNKINHLIKLNAEKGQQLINENRKWELRWNNRSEELPNAGKKLSKRAIRKAKKN